MMEQINSPEVIINSFNKSNPYDLNINKNK